MDVRRTMEGMTIEKLAQSAQDEFMEIHREFAGVHKDIAELRKDVAGIRTDMQGMEDRLMGAIMGIRNEFKDHEARISVLERKVL